MSHRKEVNTYGAERAVGVEVSWTVGALSLSGVEKSRLEVNNRIGAEPCNQAAL